MSKLLLNENDCNVKKEIELLDLFLHSEDFKNLEENKITDFGSIDLLYLSTNERLDLYYENDLKDKRVLTVTASGDHALNAAFAGSKDITSFDINRIAKYYAGLKVAMVKRYINSSFLESMDFLFGYFNSFFNDKNKTILFSNLLKDLSNYLTDDQKKFWDLFLDIVSEGNGHITQRFSYYDSMSSFIENNVWTKERNYLQLKENLNDCSINYVDSNVNNLRKMTFGKFDLIYLSNILGRMFKNQDKLLIYLRKMLNNNGMIYDYDWGTNTYSEGKIIKLLYGIKKENLKIENIEKSGIYVYKYRKKLLFKGENNGK